jgi:hypothetical protein
MSLYLEGIARARQPPQVKSCREETVILSYAFAFALMGAPGTGEPIGSPPEVSPPVHFERQDNFPDVPAWHYVGWGLYEVARAQVYIHAPSVFKGMRRQDYAAMAADSLEAFVSKILPSLDDQSSEKVAEFLRLLPRLYQALQEFASELRAQGRVPAHLLERLERVRLTLTFHQDLAMLSQQERFEKWSKMLEASPLGPAPLSQGTLGSNRRPPTDYEFAVIAHGAWSRLVQQTSALSAGKSQASGEVLAAWIAPLRVMTVSLQRELTGLGADPTDIRTSLDRLSAEIDAALAEIERQRVVRLLDEMAAVGLAPWPHRHRDSEVSLYEAGVSLYGAVQRLQRAAEYGELPPDAAISDWRRFFPVLQALTLDLRLQLEALGVPSASIHDNLKVFIWELADRKLYSSDESWIWESLAHIRAAEMPFLHPSGRLPTRDAIGRVVLDTWQGTAEALGRVQSGQASPDLQALGAWQRGMEHLRRLIAEFAPEIQELREDPDLMAGILEDLQWVVQQKEPGAADPFPAVPAREWIARFKPLIDAGVIKALPHRNFSTGLPREGSDEMVLRIVDAISRIRAHLLAPSATLQIEMPPPSELRRWITPLRLAISRFRERLALHGLDADAFLADLDATRLALDFAIDRQSLNYWKRQEQWARMAERRLASQGVSHPLICASSRPERAGVFLKLWETVQETAQGRRKPDLVMVAWLKPLAEMVSEHQHELKRAGADPVAILKELERAQQIYYWAPDPWVVSIDATIAELVRTGLVSDPRGFGTRPPTSYEVGVAAHYAVGRLERLVHGRLWKDERTASQTWAVEQWPDQLPVLRGFVAAHAAEIVHMGANPIHLLDQLSQVEGPLAALGQRHRPFPDVPSRHWAAGAVHALKRQGLLVGYPDGLFRGR